MLKKDIQIEERDRYRPLLCLKRDFQEFMLDIEKVEKKDTINLDRETEQQFGFIERQKQDIRQVKALVAQQKTDSSTLDKIHAKV